MEGELWEVTTNHKHIGLYKELYSLYPLFNLCALCG